jgi:hypothetical protein
VPGIKLPAADALSRCPDHIPEDDDDNKDVTVLPDKLFIGLINTELQNQILESSKYDPDAAKAFEALRSKNAKFINDKYSLYETTKTPLLLYENKVVIPQDQNL